MQTKLIQITRTNPSEGAYDITSEISDLLGDGWAVQSITGAGGAATPVYAGELTILPQLGTSWLVLLTKEDV